MSARPYLPLSVYTALLESATLLAPIAFTLLSHISLSSAYMEAIRMINPISAQDAMQYFHNSIALFIEFDCMNLTVYPIRAKIEKKKMLRSETPPLLQ